MKTFRGTFEKAEAKIRPLLQKLGFELSEILIDEPNNQGVFGFVRYLEKPSYPQKSYSKKFIQLNVAPLRLELDLEIGRENLSYSVFELHALESNSKFPERTHDLYKAMYDENQLEAEFKRLVKVLIQCGKRLNDNDEILWRDLKDQRISQMALEEIEQNKKKAHIAFKAQQWHEVVELLENEKLVLSKLDHGYLMYAKKKLS